MTPTLSFLNFQLFPFSSVGVEADGEKLDMVVKALAGKNVDEMMAEGAKMLASMPSGTVHILLRANAPLS